MIHKDKSSNFAKAGKMVVSVLLSVCSIVFVFHSLVMIFVGSSFGGFGVHRLSHNYNLLERFDNYIINLTSTALDGILQLEKIYMLSDNDPVAPEPNQSNYGVARDPKELESIIDTASERLNGEDLLFTTETSILEDSSIRYYLDDSIFAITWKEPINNGVFTFAEVKIQHPSQFRRFLADGVYGSDRQYLSSQMSASVNAVVASAGDFYKYRSIGSVVYNGKVEKYQPGFLDNCYIDAKGDLIFTRAEELTTKEELEQFVEDRNIRFGLSFGPILVENGQPCVRANYPIGEIAGNYARAALCQLGPLHYVVVTVNEEGKYWSWITASKLADILSELGVDKAYNLDGGQTATIVMNDQVINRVSFGAERYISDIFYFATAIPD